MTSSHLDTSYNGWANYETWNVALWINNDYDLYCMARALGDYVSLVAHLAKCGVTQTDDGVDYNDPAVNVIQINSDVFDF